MIPDLEELQTDINYSEDLLGFKFKPAKAWLKC